MQFDTPSRLCRSVAVIGWLALAGVGLTACGSVPRVADAPPNQVANR